MTVYWLLGVLFFLIIVSLLAFTWAMCAMSGRCDEAEARMRAAAVRQQMRDIALRKLGGEDEAA